MLSQSYARREFRVAHSYVVSPERGCRSLYRRWFASPVRRRGSSSAATLAWSEPLTTLLRSAPSRVSSSRSLCKAAYEDPLRLPSEAKTRGQSSLSRLLGATSRAFTLTARGSAPSEARHARVSPGEPFASTRSVMAAAQNQRRAHEWISLGEARGVSSEGAAAASVAARRRGAASRKATLQARAPEEDTPRRSRAMDSRKHAKRCRTGLTGACSAIGSIPYATNAYVLLDRPPNREELSISRARHNEYA
jgi:hypothetical protein